MRPGQSPRPIGSFPWEDPLSDVKKLKVKVFADGADLAGMREMAANPMIKGFTTNPTLLKKAGMTDYRAFASAVPAAVPDRPASFAVYADDFGALGMQARRSAASG